MLYNYYGESMKRIFIWAGVVFIILGLSVFGYIYFNGISSYLRLELNGDSVITINLSDEYVDKGIKTIYNEKEVDARVFTAGNVDTNKVGEYKITYDVRYKNIDKKITRNVKVVDTIAPVITLNGDSEEKYTVGDKYVEKGATASDNYDNNLTDKIEITNNIDDSKEGVYEVVYKVSDSSNNVTIATRKVTYKKKIIVTSTPKIAVLNYHFFYDPDLGESCNQSICEKVKDFRAQLDYLKNNGYKTLTMKEFRDWMYGEIELPSKSVLITVDDGWMGTGTHNGNKLIPILEEYQMHATLFLVTGWWDVSNYQSDYLEIESHTNDMHISGYCKGKTRGAQMLCYDKEKRDDDLRKSIKVTGSKTAFCFPFYAYDAASIQSVKDVGFELAFVGGWRKASRLDDKYKIPRFAIQKTTSLAEFARIVG